jgi:malonyl-CoA/methylmalonyl-CoA synthetase
MFFVSPCRRPTLHNNNNINTCPPNRYGDLLDSSRRLAARIAPLLPPRGAGARDGPRIGVYAEPGFGYVAASWAAWLSGGVCVPVAPAHPPAEVEYVLKDSGAAAVLAPEGAAGKLQDAAARAGAALHVWDPALFAAAVPEASVADGSDGSSASPRADSHASAGTSSSSSTTDADAGALIIYTSGTTGRPKGALHTHGSLRAQAGGLVDAWGWRASDRILHALPLHHIHGIVNAALCAHLAGAGVDFAASFQPNAMWRRLIKVCFCCSLILSGFRWRVVKGVRVINRSLLRTQTTTS